MFLDRSATAILLIGFLSFMLGGCQRGNQSLPPNTKAVGTSPTTADVPEQSPSISETSGWGPQLKTTGYDRVFSIIVGIDEYSAEESDLDPLRFAVNDARELRDVLQQEFGFVSENCKFLTNKTATKAALIEALQIWLTGQKLTANDALLVFFAGHGLIDRQTNVGDGYLATVDSRRGDLEGSCLPVSWLAEHLNKLPCRHKLLILDSCYSGRLFQPRVATAPIKAESERTVKARYRDAASQQSTPDDGLAKANSTNDPFKYYFSQPCFVGMSAGRVTPVYDGLGANRHSIFTAALIEELRNRADSDRPDQSFTFREIATRTETRVREMPDSQQIPDWGFLAPGDGDFVFQPTERRVTPRARKRQTEYTQLIAQAEDEFQQQHLTEAHAILERCPPDLRAWEWGYLQNRLNEVLRLVDADTPMVISPDERTAACKSDKDRNNIIVFDLSDGKPLHVLKGHKTPVSSIAFAPGGKYLVSGNGDRLAERGNLLATGLPSEIIAWNYRTGELLSSADCEGCQIRTMTFDDAGTRIAAVLTTTIPERRTKAKVIKLETGEGIFTIDSRTGTGMTMGTWMILGAAFPNEPDTLAILLERESPPPKATKNVIQYYNTTTGQRSTIVSTPSAGLPTFNPNNGKVLARSDIHLEPGTLRSPQEIRIRAKNRPSAMNIIFVPPDDRREALSQDAVLLLEDGRLVPDDQPRQFFKDHSLLTVWEAKSGQLLSALPKRLGLPSVATELERQQFADRWVTNVVRACSKNGHLAALTSGDTKKIEKLEIVETASGRVIQKFECDFRPMVVEFSADASLIAMSGVPEKQYQELIEPALKEKRRSVPGVHGETRIWEVESGHLKSVLPSNTRGSIFSPDGRTVSLGRIPRFELWDIVTAAMHRVVPWDHEPSLTSHHVFHSTRFSPDGRLIAASINGIVKVWSVQSDRELLSLQGDANQIDMLCFDHSSRRLATVGSGHWHRDRVVRIWDIQTGDLVFKVSIPNEVAYNIEKPLGNVLMFANEGKTLMAIGNDNRSIVSWNASTWTSKATE